PVPAKPPGGTSGRFVRVLDRCVSFDLCAGPAAKGLLPPAWLPIPRGPRAAQVRKTLTVTIARVEPIHPALPAGRPRRRKPGREKSRKREANDGKPIAEGTTRSAAGGRSQRPLPALWFGDGVCRRGRGRGGGAPVARPAAAGPRVRAGLPSGRPSAGAPG